MVKLKIIDIHSESYPALVRTFFALNFPPLKLDIHSYSSLYSGLNLKISCCFHGNLKCFRKDIMR